VHFLFESRAPTPPTIEPVPTIFPKIEGAEIAAVTVGRRVAGDFYDCVRVSPERILLGLLDVAGRRESNRGILTTAQEIFRNLGTQLFSRSDINESDAMTELCVHINRRLTEISTGVHPCPAFVACYHEKFGTLCYTNAGHTQGLLRDRTGIIELPSTGLPLGLFSHATCEAPTVAMEKCGALLLVSRGVVECGAGDCDTGEPGEEFGLDRVKHLFASTPTATAQTLCASVLKVVEEFSPEPRLRDDRTALSLLRTA
jgi:serine phosphatase RsbU (regulator of sigma subunit)